MYVGLWESRDHQVGKKKKKRQKMALLFPSTDVLTRLFRVEKGLQKRTDSFI